METTIKKQTTSNNPVRVKSLDDIRFEINKTPKPDFIAKMKVTLGGCGFGMPVIKSYKALMSMSTGDILRLESEHPCSFSDIHAWARSNNDIELLGVDIEGKMMIYYLRRVLNS